MFDKFYVGATYDYDSQKATQELPYDLCDTQVTPNWKEIKGWNCSLEGIEKSSDIPQALKEYVDYLEEALECRISIISTGPDRNETIVMRHPYDA